MRAFSRSKRAQAATASNPAPLGLALNWALEIMFINFLPLIERAAQSFAGLEFENLDGRVFVLRTLQRDKSGRRGQDTPS